MVTSCECFVAEDLECFQARMLVGEVPTSLVLSFVCDYLADGVDVLRA